MYFVGYFWKKNQKEVLVIKGSGNSRIPIIL